MIPFKFPKKGKIGFGLQKKSKVGFSPFKKKGKWREISNIEHGVLASVDYDKWGAYAEATWDKMKMGRDEDVTLGRIRKELKRKR